MPGKSAPSTTSIGIVEAHDVVFAEVRARLHLDDLEGHLPGVLEPVAHAERDERRFVFAQEKLLVAARDERRAAHDDPVFGAVVMHLKRETRAGRHDDALHLEALAVIDRVVETPRAARL